MFLLNFDSFVFTNRTHSPNYLLAEVNPRLIVARVTGWGQTGPMAQSAGHDTNYVALTGVMSLFARGPNDPPIPPINILGDFAGGGSLAFTGILLALHERNRSGKGQVVDAAMVDGVSHLATFIHRMKANGVWKDTPGTNLLDSGAPFYDTYTCSDGKFLSVGSIEPQFYALLLEGLGLSESDDMPGSQMDRKTWASNKRVIAGRIAMKSRDHWAEVFGPQGKLRDACVAPILTLTEAGKHPHNVARNVFQVNKDGSLLPNPAPRLSRTPGSNQKFWRNAKPGENTRTAMMMYGFSDKEIIDLENRGVVSIAEPPASKI